MLKSPRLIALLLAGTLAGCAAPTERAEAASADGLRLGPLGAYLAARHAQQQRDYGAAADFYAEALRQDPGDADLMNRAFRLGVSEGRWEEALALAPKLAEINPDDPIANLLLALDKVRRGAFDAAFLQSRDLPEEGLHRLATPLVQAWVKLGAGDPAAAQRALEPMGEVRGLGPLRDLHAALIADLAGDAATAAAKYDAVLAASQRLNWRAVDLVGNFYERHGRAAEARALYQRFADETASAEQREAALARLAESAVPAPRVATPLQGVSEGLFDLASVINQPEALDLALLYGRLALFLQPDFALAQLLVADILESQRRPEAALAMNRAIDPRSPYGWTARLRAASNLQALERTEEAVATLREMAAAKPEREQPLIQLGDLLRQEERFAEAADAYDAAFRRIDAPEQRHWSLYYSRGIALERSGEWGRAEADLLRALELQPEQPYVLNYLGYSWVDKGQRLQEAFAMIERAVQLRPNDGYIVDSLGWAHYRLGDYDQATGYLERAVELKPQDATINDHLGDVYWRIGRHEEARAQWQRALMFDPAPEEIARIEDKLANGLENPPAPPAPATARSGG
jgi:tetratricopeptide (TPR) repeat protein